MKRKVLILNPGADHAGVGISIKHAFDRHSREWEVRHVRRRNRFDYPKDIEWRKGDHETQREVERLFAEADVVHVMDYFTSIETFDGWQDKPRIIHHHGQVFRRDIEGAIARAEREGIEAFVATHDMVLHPSLTWLPNPVDVEMLRAYRTGPGERLRIVQSPTSRKTKSTDAFMSGIAHLDADIDIIEQASWTECLERKGRADIVLDNLTVGYAVAGIEAMAMGIPVVSGSPDPATTERIRSQVGFLPYLHADPDTVAQAVEALARDPKLRREYGDRGSYFAQNVHAPRRVVATLSAAYERALAR